MSPEDRIKKRGFKIIANKNGTFTAKKKFLSITRPTIEELVKAVNG